MQGYPANKNLFPRNLPPVANRARSNIEMLVVGTTKCIKPVRRPALPGFGFIYFKSFMVKLGKGCPLITRMNTNEYFAVNLILHHKIKLTASVYILLVSISAIRG